MKLQFLIIFCAVKSIFGGISPVERFASRIYGGEDAKDGQAPFQCSMQWYEFHFCGCAIISDQWILSAGHCVWILEQSTEDEDKVNILVGTNDLYSGGVRYKPREFIVHENFDDPIFAFDIGLIRVDKIEFNEKIQPINITPTYVEADAVVQAFGWGQTAINYPQFLQTINLTVISNEICEEKLGGSVHDTHLCTFTKVGEGICFGDSGSSLVLDDELVGLAAWAVPCAIGYPDGFTRLSEFYEWIQSKIHQ